MIVIFFDVEEKFENDEVVEWIGVRRIFGGG